MTADGFKIKYSHLKMTKKKSIVTGGVGFIGSNLVDALVKKKSQSYHFRQLCLWQKSKFKTPQEKKRKNC